MKPCLKLTSRSSSPNPGYDSGCSTPRKCVAFGDDGSEHVTVFTADEWDRTPTEPARKLSYQDMLELKEIQRSLPRANQLPDPISGRAPSHYLSAVPIGLLPLLPESDSPGPASLSPSPAGTPAPSSPTTPAVECTTPSASTRPTSRYPLRPDLRPWKPPPPPQYHIPKQPQQHVQLHPAHLAHLLPARPAPQRQKPRFAFLPLLDSPTSPSPPAVDEEPEHDEPPSPSRSSTPDVPSSCPPSTYASSSASDTSDFSQPSTPSLTTTSSPASCSRDLDPEAEPPYFQLPPLRRKRASDPEAGDFFPGRHHKEDEDVLFPLHNAESDAGYFSSTFGDEPRYYRGRNPSVNTRLHAVPSPTLIPPSPLTLSDAGDGGAYFARGNGPSNLSRFQPAHLARCEAGSGSYAPTPTSVPAPAPKVRRRNVIVVNDMEIELDADDEDDGVEAPASSFTPLLSEEEEVHSAPLPSPEEKPEPKRVLDPEGESIPPPPSSFASPLSSPVSLLLPSLSRSRSSPTQTQTKISSSPSTENPTPRVSPPTTPTPTGLHAPIRFKRAVPPPSSSPPSYQSPSSQSQTPYTLSCSPQFSPMRSGGSSPGRSASAGASRSPVSMVFPSA